MKKSLTLTLIALLSIVSLTAFAGKKDKKTVAPKKPAVVLATAADSLSYTAGMTGTEGLINFLLQEKVDTAYMEDFVRGFEECAAKANDPAFKAYSMGSKIYDMLMSRFAASIKNELNGTKDSLDMKIFNTGFTDILRNDTTNFTLNKASEYFNSRMAAITAEKKEAQYGKNRREGEAFLAENAKKEGVKTTASGLQYKVIEAGNGPIPTATQTVRVKYEGKLLDGKVFDSSYKRSDPITEFPCNRVIKGWTEALTMMPVGSKWELYIPYNLAYGEQDMGEIPPFSTLIFTVELIGIK